MGKYALYCAFGLIGFVSQSYVAAAAIIGCYKGMGNKGYSKWGIVIPFLIGTFLRNDLRVAALAFIAWLLCVALELVFGTKKEEMLLNHSIQGAFSCMMALIIFFSVNGFDKVKSSIAIVICTLCTGVMIYLVNMGVDYYLELFNKNRAQKEGKTPASLCERLSGISDSIECFVKTFDEVAAAKELYDDYRPGVKSVINRATGRVCMDCRRKNICWSDGAYEAFDSLIKLVEGFYENKGFTADKLPEFIKSKCERRTKLLYTVASAIEILHTEELWKEKMRGEKEMMKKQITTLGTLIKGISQDIGDGKIAFLDMENQLEKELSTFTNQVLAYGWRDKKGRLEIELKQKNSEVFEMDCHDAAQKISKLVNKKMVFEGLRYRNSRELYAKFIEKSELSVATGIAVLNKQGEKISGDSFTYSCIKNGIFLAGLCDGMGTGEGAAIASNAALSLIEGLIEGGIDMETAASFVNSALLIQCEGNMFVTLDIAVIDLYDGEAKFLKIGAAPTFVKSKNEGKWLFTNQLPAGIDSDVEMLPETMTLQKDDVVILMSDGVFEALLAKASINDIMKTIDSLEMKNPQQLADDILNLSLENSISKDDMSVMTLRIY